MTSAVEVHKRECCVKTGKICWANIASQIQNLKMDENRNF